MNLAEIQARHDAMQWDKGSDWDYAYHDRAWLLSDRKGLASDILDRELTIIEQETEIRLLREVQRADDLYIAAMIAGDNESKLVFADGWKVARAALAEFDKGKL